MNKISKIISILALFLGLHVAASASLEHKVQYLSANASISNPQMGQLKDLYKPLSPELQAQGLTLQQTPSDKYHLTLMCLNVYLAGNITEQQKKEVSATVERVLQQEVSKALESEKEFNMRLPFTNMTFFKKHAVALFASNPLMDNLIDNIEKNFAASHDMQHFTQNGIVTRIQPKQKERRLHVTIAKMACKRAVTDEFFSHFSYEWQPEYHVSDIIVKRCSPIISVQLRSYIPGHKPVTVVQEAPRKATLASASEVHAQKASLFSYKNIALCCLGLCAMWWVTKKYMW